MISLICIFAAHDTQAQEMHEADELESSLKLESRPAQKVIILLSLSDKLKNENPEKALGFARDALKISETSNDQEKQLRSLVQIAELCHNKGDIKQAMISAQQALELAEKLNNREESFNAQMVIGYVYDAIGDYEKSTESFFYCLNLGEQSGDQQKIFSAYYGIGYSNFSHNNFNKALDYFQKALSISREINDTTGISCGLNNISAVYGSLNDTQFLERYVREAIAINLKMNNLLWVSINYGNLAQYYMERKNFDSAYCFIQKGLEIASRIQNAALITNSTGQLANYYVLTGDIDKGLEAAFNALKLGQKFGYKKNEYEISLLLRDIFMKKKDYALAYHYDTLRYQLKDSLNLDANNSLTTRLELQYDLEKSAKEKRLSEQKRNAATIIVTIILLASIILMLLFIIRHRLRSKFFRLQKEKLEGELEFRNKEIASNVMSLMKKNEIISEIIQRLIKIQQEAVKEETRTAIEKIATDLQRSMEKGIWDEFELRFRQVHKEFYDKLMNKYPDLSPNEQKLCAFLRLNMSNKEISELTGQSIKALETARYRLRIKFGLSNSQVNLITFLSSL